MRLTPRYDDPLVLDVEGPANDQAVPLVRQRRRMEQLLASLPDEQWGCASRCDGWSVQDVVAHLIGTNQFWSMSILSGVAGSPTRVLAAFDPAATPPLMVGPMRSMSPAEVLTQFVDTNADLFAAVDGLDAAGWQTLGESPAGHVQMRMVANHALWDAWIHERDIVLPLGLVQDEEADEVVSCLRYAAAIAPVLASSFDPTRRGSIAIDATDPDVCVVVEVNDAITIRFSDPPAGAVHLTGRAVDLVESLSIRAPLACEIPPEGRWLFEGLAMVFDAAAPV